jgi:hypothetical protein
MVYKILNDPGVSHARRTYALRLAESGNINLKKNLAALVRRSLW